MKPIIDALPSAALLLDAAERIVLRNKAAEDLFELSVPGGDDAPQPLPEHLGRLLRPLLDRVRTDDDRGPCDIEVERRSGARLHLEVTIVPVRDPVASAASTLVLVSDITNRRRLELEFRQIQKQEAIGRLAGGLAHDFNNNLTCVLGSADVILHMVNSQAGLDRDRLRAYLQDLIGAAENASKLTAQLLASGRRQVMQPKPTDCNTLIRDMAGMLQRLIGEQIEIVTRLASDLGAVLVDAPQLEQVLLNLVVNARDAMPGGGTLTLESANVLVGAEHARAHPGTTEGRYVVLVVSDTGIGMDDLVATHLFEPFFTTKPPGKGTGLGLATVYGIVTQSGGHILVDSALGRGSTFKIFLPRIDAAAEPARKAAPPEPRSTAVSETILLVEDNAPIRGTIAMMLEGLGHHVIDVGGAKEALEIVRRREPAITMLMTDIAMPDMSGIVLASLVREHLPGLPVLYMSGFAQSDIMYGGSIPTDVSFISKPFRPGTLARKIGEATGHRGSQADLDVEANTETG